MTNKYDQNIPGVNLEFEDVPKQFHKVLDEEFPHIHNWGNVGYGLKRVGIYHEGKLVGFYGPRKDRGYWRTGSIYILPNYRGLGLASKAVNDFFSKVEGKGLAYIEPHNISSMKAYEKAGFKKHSVFTTTLDNSPVTFNLMIKEPNKYLEQIEKQASFILGGAVAHVAQNIATKAALGNKHISKYLANSFAEGSKGVVNTSIKARAARLLSGATVPDIAVAHKKFHELGGAMKPLLEGATKRQKVGLRMLSEGRVGDLHKYKLHQDPLIQKANDLASKSLKLPSLTHNSTAGGKAVEKIFKDKSHPLASNILKNISRGKNPVGKQYKPGTMSSKTPMLGAVGSALLEPAGGALNTVKTLTSSKTFGNTRLGAKINSVLEKQFIKKPVTSGLAVSKKHGVISNMKHRVSELFVNPVSAQLKRTSAAFSDALKS